MIEKNYEGVESNKINSSTSSSMTHMTFCLHSIPFLQGGLVSHLWRSYCPPPSPPFPSSLFFLSSPYHLSSLKIFLIIFSLFCVCVSCVGTCVAVRRQLCSPTWILGIRLRSLGLEPLLPTKSPCWLAPPFETGSYVGWPRTHSVAPAGLGLQSSLPRPHQCRMKEGNLPCSREESGRQHSPVVLWQEWSGLEGARVSWGLVMFLARWEDSQSMVDSCVRH